MSGSLPQLQTFQLPDVGGVVNALQGLELNRMRSQQLQGAEQERNNLRAVFADPNFNPSSPDAAARILRAAPNTGAQVFNALTAGQREQRQAQTALTESELKHIELGQALLRPVRDLPEAERPRAYTTWLAGMERRIPGFSASAPREYSDAGYYTLLAKASEIVANQRPPQYTITPTSGGVIATDPKNPTNSFFVPAGDTPPNAPPPNAPPAPGAPAPRAAAPGLTPAQLQAAHMLRGFERFEGTPYYDVNAYRGGFGSDQTTRADGTVVPVQQGMTISREDAERDLARRIPEFTQRAERNIGAENFARLPPNAQAALISIAYNYGHIPESLLPAARSGDLTALSQAVAALPANPSRRQSEAAVIAGQGPRLVQANAMVPNATPANAMLAPPDATVVPQLLGTPEFPGLPRPATLSDADLLKRIRDVQSDEAKARMLEQIRRETAASRAVEEGEKAGSIRRGQLTAEQERTDREKTEGRTRLESVLRDMYTQYERLNARGGIPSESRSAGANIGAFAAGTAPGQMVGRALATPSQTARNQIESLRNELLQAFKAATGMGAKEADSNADVLRLMSAMSDTTMSIESVRGIMQNFSKRYGLKELNFPETTAPAPAAAPRDGVPDQRRGAATPAQGQYREGQTATGPNGQRVIFRGGQWVPVQ